MVLNWLTGKEEPDFWKEYLKNFEKNPTGDPISKRYLVFDCEKTGQDWKNDQITVISAVGVHENSIHINDFFEVYIENKSDSHTNLAVEKLLKVNVNVISEAEALQKFIIFIKDATLVGHQTNLDIEMINQSLKKMNLGKLKNEIIDINVMHQRLKNLPEDHHNTLDELCEIYKIKKNTRSTASGDAFVTALLFLKLKKKLRMQ